MKIKIDYHFHPNLPKNEKKANKKCKKIWNFFENKKLNAVLITEHSYKNPKRAFVLMKKHKPSNLFCFPGIECITKEGIDIIVFSSDENIYNYKELMSFNLSYFDLINFVNSKENLYSFITHPHTLGLTSVINKLGNKHYLKSLNLVNAVEISNGAFDNLFFLIDTYPFKIIFKSKIEKIKKLKNLPQSEYPLRTKFLAAGSDSHHIEEIGNSYEIEAELDQLDSNKLFDLIVNNQGKGKIYYDSSKGFSLFLLIKSGLTSLVEFIIKHSLRLKYKIK